MINKLKLEHPRLFINHDRIDELNKLAVNDYFFQQLKEGLIKKANRLITEDTVEFKITGPRMLKNCQEILSRVTTLSLTYHLTGNKIYAARAKEELVSAAGFPHWNKDHFLDTAELITAFAIGYDWLYNVLQKSDLEIIKNAMITKGINKGLEEHCNNIWWAGHKYNWNQVCNGGLIIGALAVIDVEPELFDKILSTTCKYLPIAFNSYGKEGGWEGGPEYWQYTTWYSALLIDALEHVTGDDLGLSKTEGFDKTALFPVYSAGPTDRYFNFADADETYNALPVLFWLGNRFNLQVCINENHRLLQKALYENKEYDAFNLVWYQPAKIQDMELPSSKIFCDINTGYIRSEWKNSEATFIGFKGGNNQADHTHLDLGSFILDMNGIRWAIDLGRDNYDLPGYFDLSEGGGRWNYFRLNTHSHNTLVLNNDNQRANAKAVITHFEEEKNITVSQIDLSEAYKPHANSVIRTIKLINNTAMIITDQIVWSVNEKVAQWQMLTDAEIVLYGNKAQLMKEGKKIAAIILHPADAVFESISAEQAEPENNNTGCKQLIIRKNAEDSFTEFEVFFFHQ